LRGNSRKADVKTYGYASITTKPTMNDQHTTIINEEPVRVPQHFNDLNEVKLKYHLQLDELIEA